METANSITVSGAEMLRARERRAEAQRLLREAHQTPIISFTMNIAGPLKLSPLIEAGFREGCRLIEARLHDAGLLILAYEDSVEKTGCEARWAVQTTAPRLKREMLRIEEDSDLGRLFDIDVHDADGLQLTRADFGYAPRSCLLCGEIGHVCARLGRHTLLELMSATEALLRGYFLEQRADEVAATACRALLYEVGVTPKPGLVDRADNGAHSDMDFFTFIDSGSVLAFHFRRFFLLGAKHAALSPPALFARLRYPGMEAENAMRGATGGVNTHKGLIFSLGLLTAALGRLYQNGEPADTEALLELCAAMTHDAFAAELAALSSENARTGGERLYLQSGHGGVRSEAAAGYPTVRRHGLPALRRNLAAGYSANDAGLLTLLTLIGETRDSNIHARRGPQLSKSLAERMRHIAATEDALGAAAELNREFIAENISPGGAADLLAICFFLYFLEQL